MNKRERERVRERGNDRPRQRERDRETETETENGMLGCVETKGSSWMELGAAALCLCLGPYTGLSTQAGGPMCATQSSTYDQVVQGIDYCIPQGKRLRLSMIKSRLVWGNLHSFRLISVTWPQSSAQIISQNCYIAEKVQAYRFFISMRGHQRDRKWLHLNALILTA